MFDESDGVWTRTQKLAAGDSYFGVGVALSGKGALVGDSGGSLVGNKGAAYAFRDSGGVWRQILKFTTNGGPDDAFGNSVAFDDGTALIGADHTAIEGNETQGAAYFYDESDVDLTLSTPETIGQSEQYISQAIVTNNASMASPPLAVTIAVPAAATFVSATAGQGGCSDVSGTVTCDFGRIAGNGGAATANVTLKVTGTAGMEIENAAGIAKAIPALTASAPTLITPCPSASYIEHGGILNPGLSVVTPPYQAPAGQENAILTAPSGSKLFVRYKAPQHGWQVYRIPGNQVHRPAPAGNYSWEVKAGTTGGAFTLCIKHP